MHNINNHTNVTLIFLISAIYYTHYLQEGLGKGIESFYDMLFQRFSPLQFPLARHWANIVFSIHLVITINCYNKHKITSLLEFNNQISSITITSLSVEKQFHKPHLFHTCINM